MHQHLRLTRRHGEARRSRDQRVRLAVELDDDADEVPARPDERLREDHEKGARPRHAGLARRRLGGPVAGQLAHRLLDPGRQPRRGNRHRRDFLRQLAPAQHDAEVPIEHVQRGRIIASFLEDLEVLAGPPPVGLLLRFHEPLG